MVTQGNTVTAPSPAPDVISAYSHGWKMLWKQFGWLLLILVITWAISAAIQTPVSLLQGDNPNFAWALITLAFAVLVSWPLSYGVNFAYLKAARGEKVEVQDMFAGFKNYGNAILATFLTSIIVGIGIILLIVPGIYFACKLAFVPYLVVDKKMSAVKAIEKSWNMTKGYGWQVFLIGLLAIPIVILGIICLFVGVIISAMWISTALASLYYAVSLKEMPPQITPVNSAPPAV